MTTNVNLPGIRESTFVGLPTSGIFVPPKDQNLDTQTKKWSTEQPSTNVSYFQVSVLSMMHSSPYQSLK